MTSDGGAAIVARGVCWSTSSTPTVANSKTTDGIGIGAFVSSISGLTPGTPYFVRAYATNSVGTGYGDIQLFPTAGTPVLVSDIDGNAYQYVIIGTQLWLTENLKVTHFRNGDAIPNVTDSAAWRSLTNGAYCDYNNDGGNVATYGRLYNWYSVTDTRGIAPAGWHVPSDAEWKELEMFVGMNQAAADSEGFRGTDEGAKLKEAGTTHWASPNTGATNTSGFAALPSGLRSDGAYSGIGSYGVFWTPSTADAGGAWTRSLWYNHSSVLRDNSNPHDGFSVRCVKD